MWLRFLVGISLLLVSHMPLARAEPFYVGPVYTTESGMVSVVVELPPGSTPTADDFHLLVDDKLIATAHEIKLFRDSGLGMALAICVDVSGTMSRGPLDEVKKALFTFVNGARPNDRIALVSFADAEEMASSFEETRDHLTEAVRTLKTRGNKTRLYQTIYTSLDRFEDPELPKRRRIIVISDGKDEGSGGIAAEVINKARALNIPIDTVGVGRIEEQYAEALRGLSNSTGGFFEHARREVLAPTAAVARIYDNISRSLVVDFLYTADNAGGTTQNAWVELERSGQPPLRVAISEAIPRVLMVPPKSLGVLKWLWLLFAVLLAGLLVVVSRVVWRRWAKETKDSVQELVITPLPTSNLDQALHQQWVDDVKSPRRTQVGGYHFPVPELGQPTAVLLGVSGPMKGQRFPIEKEIVHVGANPDNDLSISGDEYLSGNHAYLLYKQGSLFIFDKGSTNGTFVNQQQVTASGLALSLGDHVQLGTSVSELVRAPS